MNSTHIWKIISAKEHIGPYNIVTGVSNQYCCENCSMYKNEMKNFIFNDETRIFEEDVNAFPLIFFPDLMNYPFPALTEYDISCDEFIINKIIT